MNIRLIMLVTLLAAFAACSSAPNRNSTLEQARTDFRLIEASNEVATLAADELKIAAEALRTAEAAWTDKDTGMNVDHLAYLSIQRSAIAKQTAAGRAAQASISGAASERDRMLLQARTDQATAAQRQAALAQQDAARSDAQRVSAQAQTTRTQQALAESRQDTARSDAETAAARAAASRSQQQAANANIAAADAARRSNASDAATTAALADADRSQQQALAANAAAADAARRSNVSDAATVAARAETDRAQQQALAANAAAAEAARRSDASDARASSLEAQLSELNARPTPRGMVVTLGDVLFATGASHIVPGVANNLEQLAAFMKSNPDQSASIEGYTDSVGASSYNYSLSQMRADAVRARLIEFGVNADRLVTRSFGPESPVASNDTETGRQMNRRVEIVFAQ